MSVEEASLNFSPDFSRRGSLKESTCLLCGECGRKVIKGGRVGQSEFQRICERYAASATALIELSDYRKVPVKIQNISLKGVGAVTERPLRAGISAVLTLIPHTEESPFKKSVRVMWCKKVRAGKWLSGLEFLSQGPE
ncbi:MAG: hypothetical protein GF333_06790 [Candidatus Omnitrophica bacterium]|nr:hypothetical protein [Candidatus Omnitrophota bacterium]